MIHKKKVIPDEGITRERYVCNFKRFGNFIVFQNKKRGNIEIHCIGIYTLEDAINASQYADVLMGTCPMR